MENKDLRDIYDTLLDSGDLKEIMPEATGIWETDRKSFQVIQDKLDEILDLTAFDLEEEDLYYEDEEYY